jgi:hypothetical protein
VKTMRHADCRYVAAAASVLVFGLGVPIRAQAQPQTPAAAASPSPDILGIRIGMPLPQALDLLKAHDPGHSVALEQWTIPQISGDKPITYAMTSSTTGSAERISVDVTLPPNPQVVWRIHRTLGPFTSTKENVLNSLYQKYGMPWNPDPNALAGSVVVLDWLFDEQGRLANPGTSRDDVLAMKGCMNTVMQQWSWNGWPATQDSLPSNSLVQGGARSVVQAIPPMLDPSKNPQCNNLIHVQAGIRPGATGPTFLMNITVADFTLQHRTTMALNDAVNAIVQRGAQQQRNNASQQAVPKL